MHSNGAATSPPVSEAGDRGGGAGLCQAEELGAAGWAHDAGWLARNSFTTLGGGLAGRVLQGGSQIVLARLLGPSTYGLYAIGWALLRVSNLVAPLGLNNGVIHCATRYATTDHQRLGRVLRESLALAVLFGGFITLAMCIAAPTLAHRVFNKGGLAPLICLFAAAVPLAAGLKVASAATMVSQSMRYSVYAESLAQPATNLVLILGFYLIGWRLLGAAAATVVSFGAGLALALYYERGLFPHARSCGGPPSTPVARELLRFSLVAWLGAVFVNLVPLVDRLFVGVYLTPGEVGLYQAAAQACVLLGVIEGGINAVVAPRISFLYQSSQMERLQQIYKVSTKWMLYACIPFVLVFCFAPERVLGALYGAGYVNGARPLTILSLMWLIYALTGPAGMLLIFTARQKLFSIITFCELALCATLNYLLIPHFGAVGAALATGLSGTAMMLALLLGVRAVLGFWPWDWRWVKGILATAAATGALLLVRHLDFQPALLGLLLRLALSTTVFAGSLLLLGLDSEDRELIPTLRGYLLAFARVASGERASTGNPT